MQFKPVPEPPADLAAVGSVLAAVPETAGDVADCCGRLVDETGLETREAAETWLVFLRALQLAAAEPAGYRRVPTDPFAADALETESLRRAFRERVYGAEAVLEALADADGPLTVDDAFDAVRDESARRDTRRNRDRDRDRLRRLLEWAVLLEAAERSSDGFCRGRP